MHPLVRRQLKRAFPNGAPDSPELQAFVTAVGDAYAAADDDRARLEHSLELASEELFERNLALDRRNRDMALILDNVAQGFLTVGLDGSISSECSKTLIRWFGMPDKGVPIWTLLLGNTPDLESWMQLGFDSLVAGIMPIEVVLTELPARFTRDGRQFRIDYQTIGDPLSALLVVVSDITDELARQQAERAQRELVAVVEKAYHDRSGFLAFIQESNAMLQRCKLATTPLEELAREIHTFKGNAALFGALSIAEICHELESHIAEATVAPTPDAWAQLVDAWRVFHERVDHLLGISDRRTILVDWDEYQSVLALLGDPAPAWASQIRRWGQDATRPHLERFADQARQLASRLDKAELDVEIFDSDLYVDRDRFAPLWSVLIHPVRNAVDHGVETTDVRLATGKPPRGRIVFRTEVRDDCLIVEIADDGAGIDWAAIAACAGDLRTPDLSEAVFLPGLSTAARVSSVSGRGIGMGALRATCLELGGDVELCSERGHGTTVRCTVPLAASRTSVSTSRCA